MIKIPAQHNTINPPGQVVNPIPKQDYENKSVLKLGDIIDRIQRSEGSIKTLEEARQEGYAQGFVDGKKEGFKEGIAWIKGQ